MRWRCLFRLSRPTVRPASISASCPTTAPDAEQRKYDNLRGYRFEEIDLFARDVIKKVPYVSIYNTTGQNDGDDTRDSAPEDYAEHVDLKKVAKKFPGARRPDEPARDTGRSTGSPTGSARCAISTGSTRPGWATAGRRSRGSRRRRRRKPTAQCRSPARDRGIQEGDESLPARRPQGPHLGAGGLHGRGRAGRQARGARIARRPAEAAAGLEVPQRHARQGSDPRVQGRARRRDRATTRATSTISPGRGRATSPLEPSAGGDPRWSGRGPSDFPQGLLDLFDSYVHGGISRRGFLDGAQKFAAGSS